MCVIFVNTSSRPTRQEVQAAATANPHGIGVAWSHGASVHWEKGLTLEQAQDFADSFPLPFAMHFRWATVGGLDPRLCHPFPLEYKAQTDLKGSSNYGVMMHNGHWASWRPWVGKKALRHGIWSDTRAAAWTAARLKGHFRDVFLENTVGGAIAVLMPGVKEIKLLGDFDKVRRGFLASNLMWQLRDNDSRIDPEWLKKFMDNRDIMAVDEDTGEVIDNVMDFEHYFRGG